MLPSFSVAFSCCWKVLETGRTTVAAIAVAIVILAVAVTAAVAAVAVAI